MSPKEFIETIAEGAGAIDQAVADLGELRDSIKRDHPSGRYLSLAITALEEAMNWLENAKNGSRGYHDYD